MKSALIIGLGRFGRHIAMKMNELNIETMAVDKNEEHLRSVVDYVTNTLIGDATNEQFLKSLGVSDFDVCMVAIGDDFLSALEVTSMLKELGAKKVVSRAAKDSEEKFLLRNGADAVVYPEKMMGEWAAVRYSSDHIFDYISISKDLAVFEVKVPENWIGKTIGQVDVRKHFSLNIIDIRKGEEIISAPDADYVFEADENLLVVGTLKDVQRIYQFTD